MDSIRQLRHYTNSPGLGRKEMIAKKALPKDSDLANVDKALKRAAKKARELAVKTHTPFYVFEDGKVVDLTKRK
jgi:capsule polysaccharide export protein KpsC/LpsZ